MFSGSLQFLNSFSLKHVKLRKSVHYKQRLTVSPYLTTKMSIISLKISGMCVRLNSCPLSSLDWIRRHLFYSKAWWNLLKKAWILPHLTQLPCFEVQNFFVYDKLHVRVIMNILLVFNGALRCFLLIFNEVLHVVHGFF